MKFPEAERPKLKSALDTRQTSDRTDARVNMELNLPSQAGASASGKYLGSQTPVTRQIKPERSVIPPRTPEIRVVPPRTPERRVVPPRKVRPEYPANRPGRKSHGCESNRRKHRSGCRRELKQRNERNGYPTVPDGQSSRSLRSSPVCRRFENNDDVTILDPIARANVRVRNSFAEQEYRELEALARSIFNQQISPNELGLQNGGLSPRSSSSSDSSDGLRITALPSEPRSDSEKSSNCNLESPKLRNVRPRKSSRVCRRHFHESASSSLASVRSRTALGGFVYRTTSSRGRRKECKIHGRRYIKNNAKPAERIVRSRDSEESDEGNDEIIDRRRHGGRGVNRHKSDFAILRFCK